MNGDTVLIKDPITVRQLAAQLAALPDDQQDLPVGMEGCDCYGTCSGIDSVEMIDGDRFLLLERGGHL